MGAVYWREGTKRATVSMMMFNLSFIYPPALLLLVLLLLFWLFAWLARAPNLARLGRGRYLTLVALRSLMVAALILAMAGVQLVRAVEDTAVLFLIDGSDSVSPAQRQAALDYVNRAVAAADPGDRAAMVLFGAEPAVERAAEAAAPIRRLTSLVTGSRTNIAEALQLGLALLPADAQRRVVLLSDGAENQGRATTVAQLLALRAIPIEVVRLPRERGPDLLITAVEAPTTAREGQRIPLRIALESSMAGAAQLELFADGQLVAVEERRVDVGTTTIDLSLPAGEAGFRRFEARVSAPFDTQALNNRAAAFTQVEGPPSLLIAASVPERALPLRAALEAAGLRVELRTPDAIPSDPLALLAYAAVILVDLPAAALPTATQSALRSYVEDQGGGLAMIGGSESFGAGGWRRTPLAAILPVELDPVVEDQRPDLALVLVIDRSGSMGEAASPGRNRLDLARDALFLATRGLAQTDQLAIIAFDDVAQQLLPLQPLPDLFSLEEAIGRISVGGGTNIRAGVALAAQSLAVAEARIKHLILLTDGLDSSNYTDLIDSLRAQGSTVTVVSIGGDANPSLATLAERGGGAFYRVTSAQEVPEIFLSETVRVAGRDIVEQPFTPMVLLNSTLTRDLGPLPPLYGYNASTPRATARTLLATPDGAPILAVAQVGMGRTLAWTSDLKGQWATDWLNWSDFVPFVAGMSDLLLSPPTTGQLRLELRSEGGEAVIDLLVFDSDGRPGVAGQVGGRLLDPQGQGVELTFTEVGRGRYRARIVTDRPGAYLTRLLALDNNGQPMGVVSGGLVVSYSPEYRTSGSGEALLADLALLTGGRTDPPAESLFASVGQRVGLAHEIAMPLLWLALLLLPCDIAIRRLFLRPRDLLQPRPPAAAPVTEDRIAALLASRQRRREE